MKLKVLRFYYFWLTEGPRLPYGFSKALEIRHCWYSGTTHFAVADPGQGPTSLPLFLDQTEARRAEKKFLGDRPPPHPPPPPPLISRCGSGTVWDTSIQKDTSNQRNENR